MSVYKYVTCIYIYCLYGYDGYEFDILQARSIELGCEGEQEQMRRAAPSQQTIPNLPRLPLCRCSWLLSLHPEKGYQIPMHLATPVAQSDLSLGIWLKVTEGFGAGL